MARMWEVKIRRVNYSGTIKQLFYFQSKICIYNINSEKHCRDSPQMLLAGAHHTFLCLLLSPQEY